MNKQVGSFANGDSSINYISDYQKVFIKSEFFEINKNGE